MATRAGVVEDDRTGLGVETLRRAIQDNLFYRCGNVPVLATRSDYYLAVAYTVRDRLMQRWPVSYTHLTLPTIVRECRSRWSPDH